MPDINQVAPNEVDAFMDNFLKTLPATPITSTPAATAPAQQQHSTEAKTTNVEEPSKDPSVEQGPTVDEFLKDVNKKEEEKVEEKAKEDISDISKFSEFLVEKDVLVKYEDGTLPQTRDEFVDALTQTVNTRASKVVDDLWREKVESLSPQLQAIHQYAELGVTSAKDLAEFTQKIAQYEVIAELDPKNPEHQEQIVLTQLMNSGLSEKTARNTLEKAKTNGDLESLAAEYHPSLKKVYAERAEADRLDKVRRSEDVQRFVQDNATNATYFLEKVEDLLPFKISDKNYKTAIFDLAAQPVATDAEGDPVYGWEHYIKSLQFGTEAEYRKYMKIMAYAANIDAFEKGISKNVTNKAVATEFKKIASTEGKANNSVSQERQTSSPQLRNTAPSKPWSVQ